MGFLSIKNLQNLTKKFTKISVFSLQNNIFCKLKMAKSSFTVVCI